MGRRGRRDAQRAPRAAARAAAAAAAAAAECHYTPCYRARRCGWKGLGLDDVVRAAEERRQVSIGDVAASLRAASRARGGAAGAVPESVLRHLSEEIRTGGGELSAAHVAASLYALRGSADGRSTRQLLAALAPHATNAAGRFSAGGVARALCGLQHARDSAEA
eukprot:gene1790-10355_t